MPLSRKTISPYVVGLLIGVLLATSGYALYERSQNSAGGGGATVLRLGHGLDTSHPVHLAMEYMAELLEEKSAGTLRLRISPNGQLGTETECIELLQRGSLAMTKTSTAPLESFLPEMAVFGLPYVFYDADHFWRVLDGEIGDELLASGQRADLLGLCWYDAGARSFYTKKTLVAGPDDLKGLKIRVQNSQTALEMVRTLGGTPTAMNFGELYTGLQQGLVDGAENNPPSFYSSRHFEVCKEYSLDEHTRVPDLLLISTAWWEKLSPQQQGWLREAAHESSIKQRELWRERSAESLAAVEEAGVNVTRPDPGPFIETVGPLHAKHDGTAVGDLLQRIAAVAEGQE